MLATVAALLLSAPAPHTGRFQIVTATYESETCSIEPRGGCTREKRAVVLRVDTATGATWEFVDQFVETAAVVRTRRGWVSLEVDPTPVEAEKIHPKP